MLGGKTKIRACSVNNNQQLFTLKLFYLGVFTYCFKGYKNLFFTAPIDNTVLILKHHYTKDLPNHKTLCIMGIYTHT